MDQQEPPSNVLPLFPGIDTRPFGSSTELVEDPGLADVGWNTDTGQVTLSEHESPINQAELPVAAREPLAGRRRWIRPALPAGAWLVLVLFAGGALAAGHALLSTPRTQASHRLADAHGSYPLLTLDRPMTRPSTARARTRAHAANAPRHKAAHANARNRRPTLTPTRNATATAPPAPVEYAPPSSTVRATLTYTTQAPATPKSTPATQPDTTRPATQPAGPTGLGQQLGSNCAPKCR